MAQVLRHVPGIRDPAVLVDASSRDDAAVYRIAPDRAIVATVDFFTPIVDDAATWGAIAAANALSDIYAMGARPLFALNLVGWPRDTLPFSLLGDVQDGAQRVLNRAGCLVLGGHSIDDAEPKYGFVVVGEAHPDRLLTNSGARAGDLIVLTKPLGTGILTTALKRDVLGEPELAPAVAVMTALNDGASRVALEHATAATDVTGFGLIGHLRNVVDASGVGARLHADRLPILPRALELAADGVVPGGTRRNLESVDVVWADDVGLAMRLLAADAQTSGGLLLTIPPDRVTAALDALKAAATPAAEVIGEITAERGVLRVEGRKDRRADGS